MITEAADFFLDKQLRSFHKTFLACDSRRTGKLKPEEFRTAVRHFGVIPTEEEFTAMLKEMGSEIDLDHFVMVLYYLVRGADTPEELYRALAGFDHDRDGRLAVDEVKGILRGLRRPVTEDRIDAIVQKLGKRGSISISDLVEELIPF
jgi:Ca2+-binding EF-hand superfamily protein